MAHEFFDPVLEKPLLIESYRGSDIVEWYGAIERQIERLEQKWQEAGNSVYADRLHTFLRTWRDNELTGSINRETVEVLKASTDQLAADKWQLSNYFSHLRDSLRRLVASMEELPLNAYVEEVPTPRSRSRSKAPEEAPPSDVAQMTDAGQIEQPETPAP